METVAYHLTDTDNNNNNCMCIEILRHIIDIITYSIIDIHTQTIGVDYNDIDSLEIRLSDISTCVTL